MFCFSISTFFLCVCMGRGGGRQFSTYVRAETLPPHKVEEYSPFLRHLVLETNPFFLTLCGSLTNDNDFRSQSCGGFAAALRKHKQDISPRIDRKKKQINEMKKPLSLRSFAKTVAEIIKFRTLLVEDYY